MRKPPGRPGGGDLLFVDVAVVLLRLAGGVVLKVEREEAAGLDLRGLEPVVEVGGFEESVAEGELGEGAVGSVGEACCVVRGRGLVGAVGTAYTGGFVVAKAEQATGGVGLRLEAAVGVVGVLDAVGLGGPRGVVDDGGLAVLEDAALGIEVNDVALAAQ